MRMERLSAWGKGTVQQWRVVLLFLVLPEANDWPCPLTTKCRPMASQGVEVMLVSLQNPVLLPLLPGPLQCLCQAICP